MAGVAVLAFAGAAFLRAVGMAEKDLQSELGCECLVLGPLFALIPSEAEAKRGGNGGEPAG